MVKPVIMRSSVAPPSVDTDAVAALQKVAESVFIYVARSLEKLECAKVSAPVLGDPVVNRYANGERVSDQTSLFQIV